MYRTMANMLKRRPGVTYPVRLMSVDEIDGQVRRDPSDPRRAHRCLCYNCGRKLKYPDYWSLPTTFNGDATCPFVCQERADRSHMPIMRAPNGLFQFGNSGRHARIFPSRTAGWQVHWSVRPGASWARPDDGEIIPVVRCLETGVALDGQGYLARTAVYVARIWIEFGMMPFNPNTGDAGGWRFDCTPLRLGWGRRWH